MLLGTGVLIAYDFTPGHAAGINTAPADIALDPAMPTLVMVVHPGCTCTRASLAALETIARTHEGRLSIHVFASQPRGVRATSIAECRQAVEQTIPVASFEARPAADLNTDFQTDTSGTVFLFSPEGRVLFAGGITASRGHEGDNPGLQHLLESIATGQATAGHPVFGCPLSVSADACIRDQECPK